MLKNLAYLDLWCSLGGGGGGGGGGGTLIFSYKCRLRSFFWFKILNLIIFGSFQKNEYFFGMKILWIFFLGSSQNWTVLRKRSFL